MEVHPAKPLLDKGGKNQFQALPTLDRIPIKLRAYQFAFVICLPAMLVLTVSILLVHDMLQPLRSFPECPGWEEGPDWGGSVVMWLSLSWKGDLIDCKSALFPRAVWYFMTILPVAWGLIVVCCAMCRKLNARGNIVFTLTKEMLEDLNGQCDAHRELALSFCQVVTRMRSRHARYVVVFQVIMLCFDGLLYKKTLRWIIAYQLVWLGFACCILQVAPTIRYCAQLSQTMLDAYIVRILQHHSPPLLASWSDLGTMHRKLELTISKLWLHTGVIVLVPSVPFVTLSILHFVSDPVMTNAVIVSSFLMVVAGLVLTNLLMPIANISNMFSAASPHRGELKPGGKFVAGSMAITAVIRSFAQESRTPEDEQSYRTLLELVHGHRVAVHVGVPGIAMVGITRPYVVKMLQDLVLKFPIIVSVVLWLRGRSM